MKHIILFILLSVSMLIWIPIQAQPRKFSAELLKNPQKYGPQFEELFNLNEIGTYKKQQKKGVILLENGYSKAFIKNPKAWIPYRKNIVITQIDVVYTKYPKNKEFWITNYYDLLAARITELFKLDSTLNSSDFEWNIVLQTDCDTEAETMKMFHGIAIHYFEVDEFEREAHAKGPSKPLDSTELAQYSLKVHNFIRSQGGIGDSLVFNTFDKHKQWNKALVVMDWTGSMYRYGAQAILWHTLNFKTSGIRNFVFFNDGDNKPDINKIIGETGGVYFAQAENIDRLVKTFYLVGSRGKGGDPEENDVEALLKGINRFEDFDELILIADNNSCMRDFSLLVNLNVKVNVIACGTEKGINPQYINLAYQTGGSIHSIEEEIMHLSLKVKGNTLGLKTLDYELDPENLFRIKNPTQRIIFSACDAFNTLAPRPIDPHLEFIDRHGGITDSTVYKVFDRHPLWTSSLVVMNWSPRMYTQSAQAVLWHKVHPKTSGIDYFVFANDGDRISEKQKKIGKTGGMYYNKANNFAQVVQRCDYVAKKSKGDNPNTSNAIESIVRSAQKYPDAKEIVYLADNESCIRDFKLIKYLNVPVKVVLSNVNGPINPQYINLAYKSGGSLHLITDDFYNNVFSALATSKLKLTLNGVNYVLNEEGLYDFEDGTKRRKKDCSVSTKTSLLENFGL